MEQKRIRDYGIQIGEMPTGKLNKISDVPGVKVGHATLDDARHKTGLSVILPGPDNVFLNKPVAAAHVLNGFGKTLGLMQLQELGVIETPIAATSSSSGSSTPIRRLSGHIAAVATYPPHSQTAYPAFFSAR